MWEKYSDEIGTENGPLKHMDENPQDCPHLNNFVAFDIEDWWAQCSISCMINENTQVKPSKSSVELNKPNKKSSESNLKQKSLSDQFNLHAAAQKSMQNIESSLLCVS